MVDLSISVEGLFGLTWPSWKRLVRNVEDLGFAGLYLSDHFMMPEPPDYPSLELVVALTYLADHTDHVRFGPMVSPVTIRDPVMLARQAAALDDLSDGRMVLGIGAGHMVREHVMFGYDLGDLPARFARFEEALEIITRLLRSDQPVSFHGNVYRLQDAVLPAPRRIGGPPIMVGGSGPTRTLPLVARFADIWNAQVFDLTELMGRLGLLDSLALDAGRQPDAIQRTLTTSILCWRTAEELEARLHGARRWPPLRGLSTEGILNELRSWGALVGTPEEIVTRIRDYEAAGISEIAMQWLSVDDIEGLEILATEVLPHVATPTA